MREILGIDSKIYPSLPLLLALLITLTLPFNTQAQEEHNGMTNSNTKLQEPVFRPLPLGAVRPSGWLENQLRIQRNGLSGNLDQFWPDIMDSGWTGGKDEGWERMPYWLDGVVPLAWLLDDAPLKARIEKYLDYILTHQQEDGWLGPEQSSSRSGNYKPRDPWPVFVMLKVLTQYHEATGDPRVLPAMQRFLRCLEAQLAERPLFDWNKFRWQDLVLSIHWLYDRSDEDWLLDLAATAREQGYDWINHFNNLPYKQRAKFWSLESHVVNTAMAVKAPGVWFRQSAAVPDRDAVHSGLAQLDEYHGQATGLFTGDECLAGRMPSQGTELCAVVEFMYSLELLAGLLGDPVFADRLERIAFNALPATFSPDMWAHQYDQQANQVVCKVSDPNVYATNGPDANLFGLEPNYGCCTANMHQGWPKFAAHLWMRAQDGGLAAIAYAPCLVKSVVHDAATEIAVETNYPFSEEIAINVTVDRPVTFALHLRIPGWTKDATVQLGEEGAATVSSGQFQVINREWIGTTRLILRLPMPVRIERRYNDAAAIHRGPLVYSLKIGEDWRHLRGDMPHADWEVHPTTPWNYALLLDPDNPGKGLQFIEGDRSDNPFSPEGAPVRATVQGRRLPGWDLERNAAAPPPQSPVLSDAPLENLTLIPYGCSHLRLTEFPVLGTHE